MDYAFIIEPNTYIAFENEAEQLDKCKEWGLLSEKATKTKTYFYKGHGVNVACTIVGYVDKMTAVIEFDNKQRHCIHPSYLKEMQAANYGQRAAAEADETAPAEANAATETDAPKAVAPDTVASEPQKQAAEAAPAEAVEPAEAVKGAEPDEPKAEKPAKTKATKEKAKKLELPEEKVKMTATVQEFTTVPNNFSDTDDEVIIYEAVAIEDPAIEVGLAWSSHSATLKKLELAIGDTIVFEGKIVAKKLTKHPVAYKINNPGKIQKQ